MSKVLDQTRIISIGLLGVILLQLYLLVNSSFTVWPEMILYPWLMQNNYILYKDIINPYTPLLSLILSSFFSVFGTGINNLKILTYLIILLTNVTVFWSVYKLSKDTKKAILASLIYVLLSYSYGGNGLWFELALTPILIISLMMIYISNRREELLLAGLLLGLAILIKQNAALFFLPVIYLLIIRNKIQNMIYLLLPCFVLGASTFIYLILNHSLEEFYHWAILLPVFYSAQPGFVSMPALRQYPLILFPSLALAGLSGLGGKFKEKIYWVLSFVIATSFAFPRYENFHLQVLVGLAAIFSSRMTKKYLVVFLFITLLIFVRSERKLLNQTDRFIDQETIILAEKIDSYVSVYLLNSPDLAYFFAQKLPPKLWAINFPWYFEQPGFEDRFISNLRLEKTEYIVIGDPFGGNKYDLGNYFPEKLLKYIYENYRFTEKFHRYQIWQRK